MGFVARLGGWVALGIFGGLVVGCGGVTEPRGGEGVLSNHPTSDTTPEGKERYALAKSGDRVVALGYLSEGVAQFRTLHDNLLGFDCEFVEAGPGGDIHCVPKQTAALVFLDAACTQPATWGWNWQSAQSVGDWFSAAPFELRYPGVLPSYRQAFQLGEEVYPEGPYSNDTGVFELQGTACIAASPPAKSTPAVYRLIPHSDAELAAGTLSNIDAGSGLRLWRVSGLDGSQSAVAVTTTDGQACTAEPTGELGHTANGITELVPTKRVRLGTGAAHADLFISSPGPNGVDMPVAQFPAKVYFLDEAGERCEPTQAVDGTLRCAPVVLGAYQSDHWSDAACTQRLYYSDYPGLDLTRLHAPVRANDGSLAAIATVKAYDGPVYTIDSGSCILKPTGDPVVQLDQRVDISAFPEVFETTL